MKAVVAAFNQEKALVGALSVITNLRMELFHALVTLAGNCCHPVYSLVQSYKVTTQYITAVLS